MTDANRATYMDYNATAPLKPVVREAMLHVMDTPNNASAVHKYGRQSRLWLEGAREQIATSVNAKMEGVIFTSGATEANNMALHGFDGYRILSSAIEHPAVLAARPDITQIPVDQNGVIDLNVLEDRLKADDTPALVSVMYANNETGVIQPIADISTLVHRYNGLFHSDCVQALGRLPLDMQGLGIDMLSLSAHKLGGPQGVGALVIDPKLEITPFIQGGGQEKNRRGGTENTMGIVGFGAAAENARLFPDESAVLRDKLEVELLKIAPYTIVHSKDAPRLGNTSMFSLPGIPSDTQMIHMDLAGIALSNGSACSSGRVEPSHVLTAMGCEAEVANSALRVSLGWNTQESDIDQFLEAWKALTDRVGSRVTA